jgi:hypothetical protein
MVFPGAGDFQGRGLAVIGLGKRRRLRGRILDMDDPLGVPVAPDASPGGSNFFGSGLLLNGNGGRGKSRLFNRYGRLRGFPIPFFRCRNMRRGSGSVVR